MEFTREQRRAIESIDRPLQIIAGAGSGKTQVVAERIGRLLRVPCVTPDRIVAFTFTEKAATELADRVNRVVRRDFGRIPGLPDMAISTMHAYCLRLLRAHVPDVFKFSTLTDVTLRLFVDRYSRQSGLTTTPLLNGSATLQRFRDTRRYIEVMNLLREERVDWRFVPGDLRDSAVKFRDLLQERAHFDFAGMVHRAVKELERGDGSPLGRAIRDTVRFVVVDEYQDVNPLQERLIQGLTQFGANLCVVGDDDQTIYEWRGSQVANIVDFAARHPGTETVRLVENFRSSDAIVAFASEVTGRIDPPHRIEKRISAASARKGAPGDVLALPFGTPELEAAWIADRMEALRGVPFEDRPESEQRGLSWSDMSVLYRSVKKDAGALVSELRRRGIPFQIKGMTRLFDAPEVQAMQCVFEYLAGTATEADLRFNWQLANLLSPGRDLQPLLAFLDRLRQPGASRWSSYSLQRIYLDALREADVREDTVPGEPGRRETVFLLLGKFSQVISDYEEVHFATRPDEKVDGFVKWLTFQAKDIYDEQSAEGRFAVVDAVTISTVHQAKGMEWPAVFLPALRRNRFPAMRRGGPNVFHILPEQAIEDPDRYRGGEEEEVRLFYVAVTRAQQYLAMTYSPGAANQYRRPSSFFELATRSIHVEQMDLYPLPVPSLKPRPKLDVGTVTLSFSELKLLLACPYQFKLRFVYGFNPPIHEALGYGRGLHDALAEMHRLAMQGRRTTAAEIEGLVDRHLHMPYAYPEMRRTLRSAAIDALHRYVREHTGSFAATTHTEQPVQVHLDGGVVIDGRIDLVERADDGQVTIVDFKSTDKASRRSNARDQLLVYALGYEELTGEQAHRISVRNLQGPPEGGAAEPIADADLGDLRRRIHRSAARLRGGEYDQVDPSSPECDDCDLRSLCRGDAPTDASRVRTPEAVAG